MKREIKMTENEYRSPLKEWRTRKNLTAHKVAVRAGVDQNTISRFERTGNINAYNLCKIADATGLTTDYLLGRQKMQDFKY